MALGDIAKLIDSEKGKGYLTCGEVNDLIPHDVNSSEVLDDLLAAFGTQGIDVLEGQPKLPSALEKGLENEREASDKVQLDLTLGTLKRPTIWCASTYARWAPCLYSPAKGKWALPSASSVDS